MNFGGLSRVVLVEETSPERVEDGKKREDRKEQDAGSHEDPPPSRLLRLVPLSRFSAHTSFLPYECATEAQSHGESILRKTTENTGKRRSQRKKGIE
jgi:hypothetical protein